MAIKSNSDKPITNPGDDRVCYKDSQTFKTFPKPITNPGDDRVCYKKPSFSKGTIKDSSFFSQPSEKASEIESLINEAKLKI